MKNAPIVPGVPNQYFYQNRVWPSRFHGPIYTRPVFGAPVIATPYQNFTPGYDIDRHVPQPTLSGLGATVGEGKLWNEEGGVFGPGGYGGGVFDGNISGLGSVGPRPSVKGIGMGAVSSDDMPWGSKSDATVALQSTINAHLLAMGMCPISVDGKLGPATCGGGAYVVQQKGGNPADELPSACIDRKASWSSPKKNTGNCGASAPVTTSPLPVTTGPSLQSGMSSSSKRALGFALGGALAIGAVVMLRKKR